MVSYQNSTENTQFGLKFNNFCVKSDITRNYTGKHKQSYVIFSKVTNIKQIKCGGHMVIMENNIDFDQNRPENRPFLTKYQIMMFL